MFALAVWHDDVEAGKTACFAFPGTCHPRDWEVDAELASAPLTEAVSTKTPPNELDLKAHKCSVHRGFLGRFKEIFKSSQYTKALADMTGSCSTIIFTGHSLGGAVAMIATLNYKFGQQAGRPDTAEVRCITFGAPMLGDVHLQRLVESQGWRDHFLHVVSRHDLVPRVLISKLKGAKKLLKAAFSGPQSQEALVDAEGMADWEQSAQQPANVASDSSAAAWHKLWKQVYDFCGATRSAIIAARSMAAGVTKSEANNYRPFGRYVICTSSGTAVFDQPAEVLQMLFVTMECSSSPIATPHDVVREHSMVQYQAAARTANICGPKWTRAAAFYSDASSLHELGMLKLQEDLLKLSGVIMEQVAVLSADVGHTISASSRVILDAIQDLSRQVAPGSLRSAPGYKEAAAEQKLSIERQWEYMHERIGAYEYGANDFDAMARHVARADALQVYKQAGLAPESLSPEQLSRADDMERLRRKLRDFWETTFLLYVNGCLPADFFSQSSPWLQRAEAYRTLAEPVDITNYYRQRLWTRHPPFKRHYLESNNRPDRYVFFEKVWVEEHTETYPKAESTQLALQEARAVETALSGVQ